MRKRLEKTEERDTISVSSARNIEMVLRINMQDREPQAFTVFEGDKAEDLAAQFCRQHNIVDSSKYYKLKKIVESQIQDHRFKSSQQS